MFTPVIISHCPSVVWYFHLQQLPLFFVHISQLGTFTQLGTLLSSVGCVHTFEVGTFTQLGTILSSIGFAHTSQLGTLTKLETLTQPRTLLSSIGFDITFQLGDPQLGLSL